MKHNGDCHFWGFKICTCGLLHELMIDYEDGIKSHPKLGKDLAEQDMQFDFLLALNRLEED